jgi:hypothetical protein
MIMDQRENENPWTFEAKILKAKVRSAVEKKALDIHDVLRILLMNDCILSGSCISSVYHNEEPNDFDFWMKPIPFLKAENIRNNIVESYSSDILDISEKYGDGMNSWPCVTANAITFKNKFQLITLADILIARESFDFLHCMPYYDLKNDKFYISKSQFEAIRDKKLKIANPAVSPTQRRYQKFIDRGWT